MPSNYDRLKFRCQYTMRDGKRISIFSDPREPDLEAFDHTLSESDIPKEQINTFKKPRSSLRPSEKKKSKGEDTGMFHA